MSTPTKRDHQKNHSKREHEKVVKFSISMPPSLFTFAEDRVKALGFTGQSAYLQSLLRAEMTGQRELPGLNQTIHSAMARSLAPAQ